MLSKSQIKYINSLKINKYRKTEKVFIAEGVKILDDILHSKLDVLQIFATKEWVDEKRALTEYGDSLEIVSEEELKKISCLTTPNQVLAIVKIPEIKLPDNLFEELSLLLDDIRDPGNLGTIIRIADWFGISSIICSPNTVDCYNPKVVQATMGSIARVNVIYTDLSELIEQKPKDFPVYGTLLEGDNIYQTTLSSKGFVVIGNESFGISDTIKNQLTQSLHIPSFATDAQEHAESLNASIATAIICSEFKGRVQ